MDKRNTQANLAFEIFLPFSFPSPIAPERAGFSPPCRIFFIFLQNNKKRAFVLLHPSTQRLLVYFPYSIFLLISVMRTTLNDFELIVNYSKYNSIFLIYLYTPEPGKITGKCFRSSCTLIAISVNIFDEIYASYYFVKHFASILIYCQVIKFSLKRYLLRSVQ